MTWKNKEKAQKKKISWVSICQVMLRVLHCSRKEALDDQSLTHGYINLVNSGERGAQNKKIFGISSFDYLRLAVDELEYLSYGGVKQGKHLSFLEGGADSIRAKFFRLKDHLVKDEASFAAAVELIQNEIDSEIKPLRRKSDSKPVLKKQKSSKRKGIGYNERRKKLAEIILRRCLDNLNPERKNWFVFRMRDFGERGAMVTHVIAGEVRKKLVDEGLVEYTSLNKIQNLADDVVKMFKVKNKKTGMMRIKDVARVRELLGIVDEKNEESEPVVKQLLTANDLKAVKKEEKPLVEVTCEPISAKGDNIALARMIGELHLNFAESFCAQISQVLTANNQQIIQQVQEMLIAAVGGEEQLKQLAEVKQKYFAERDERYRLQNQMDGKVNKKLAFALKEAEKGIDDLKEILAQYESEIKMLRTKLERKQNLIDIHDSQMENIKKANEALMKDNEGLKKELLVARDDQKKNDLVKLTDLQKNLDVARQSLSAKEEIIVGQEAQVNALKKELSDIKAEYTAFMEGEVAMRS